LGSIKGNLKKLTQERTTMIVRNLQDKEVLDTMGKEECVILVVASPKW
jgi:hypothetical protein